MQFFVSSKLAILLKIACDRRCLKFSLLMLGGSTLSYWFLSCTGGVKSSTLRITFRHLWSEMLSWYPSLAAAPVTFRFLVNIWSRCPPCLWVTVDAPKAGMNFSLPSALPTSGSYLLKSPHTTILAWLSCFRMSAAISEILAALFLICSSSPGSR